MEDSTEIHEFPENLLMIRTGHSLLFSGSFFELPIQYVIANATDIDMMYILNHICALPENVSAPHTFQGETLVINNEDTYPGFVRLYSTKSRRLFRAKSNILDNHDRHGPAWTKMAFGSKHLDFISSVFGHIKTTKCGIDKYKHFLRLQFDRVLAIYCPYWPSEAGEWKTRERSSGWPPSEIINKVVATGCFFVCKPHHSNLVDDTQWRFSFSQAEVILAHSWTDVQKYIYHILRLIKSEVVKACGGSDETVLCSYFFKTLMLWECERKPKDFWNDENVENLVMDLLLIMIEWLIEGCCPNYFIPKCNMINVSTDIFDFTNEIHTLMIYTKSNISQILAIYPKAYTNCVMDPMQIAVQEKVSLSVILMLVRDNVLNPLCSNMKSLLMKQLTEKNSLLLRKTRELYKGILSHSQFTKTRCPLKKHVVQRKALCHFFSSLEENGDGCSKRFLSIAESIYEFAHRNICDADCKFQSSRVLNDNINKESIKMNKERNCLDSSFNITVPCNFRRYSHAQSVRCYSRQIESEDQDKENKVTSSATMFDLNAVVKRVMQYFFENVEGNFVIPTCYISSAYLANFYYTALHDYTKASALCDTLIHYPEGRAKGGWTGLQFASPAFPIFITNELSAIFDEHFQTVLGVVTLHRFISDSSQDNSKVLIRIDSSQFVRYIKIQCKIKEGVDEPVICENFALRLKDMFATVYDTYQFLSDVFMSAVLHASRC